MWTKPSYTDLRIGFEVTMYFANRWVPGAPVSGAFRHAGRGQIPCMYRYLVQLLAVVFRSGTVTAAIATACAVARWTRKRVPNLPLPCRITGWTGFSATLPPIFVPSWSRRLCCNRRGRCVIRQSGRLCWWTARLITWPGCWPCVRVARTRSGVPIWSMRTCRPAFRCSRCWAIGTVVCSAAGSVWV